MIVRSSMWNVLLVTSMLAGCDGPAANGDAGTAEDAGAGLDASLLGDDAGSADGGDDAGPPVTCVFQPSLTLPTSVIATLEGESRNDRVSCTDIVGSLGPEHWYPLSIAERTGIELELLARFTAAVSIRTECGHASSEVVCQTFPPRAGSRARAILEPGEYFVLVDTVGLGAGGDYQLVLEPFAVADHATCDGAAPVEDGDVLYEDYEGAPAIPSCVERPLTLGTLYYSASVPDRSRLTLHGPPARPGGGIQIFESCSAFTCLADGDRWINDTGAEQQVVIAASYDGEVRHDVEIVPLPDSAFCATASAINETTGGSAEAYLGGDPAAACLATWNRNFHYFALTVPPGRIADLTASADIHILDRCETDALCLGSGFARRERRIVHGGTSPLDLIVALSTPRAEDRPLDVSVELSPAPPNATCETAMSVTPGEPLIGDLSAGGAPPVVCAPAGDQALYYRVTVPPGQLVRAEARPMSGARGTIQILSACGPRAACLDSEAFFFSTRSATWLNPGSSPADVIIAVTDATSSSGGTVELTVDLLMPPANAECSGALVLSDGVAVTQDHTTGSLLGLACPAHPFSIPPSTLDRVLYYSVEIPPAYGVEIDAAASEVAFLSGCGGSCLAYGNGSGGSVHVNRGSAAETVVVAVGSRMGSPLEDVSVTASLLPVPPNAACHSPTPLSNGVILMAQDTRLGTDDLSALCAPSDPSGVLYYTATIPAGGTLIVENDSREGTIRLLEDCSASTCLDFATVSLLAYTNSSASPRTVLVAVSNRIGQPMDVRAMISGGTGYSVSPIAAACRDVSAHPVLISGDDAVTPSMPLLLPFSLFGDPMSEFAVSTNGVVQLSGGAPTLPDSLPINEPLAMAPVPEGLIAPFWDDLVLDGSGGVRQATEPIGPAEPGMVQVIEWSGARHPTDPTGSLTFQAQLYETGVIELHYCFMSGADPDLSSGSSATIGVRSEAALGLAAEHSFDMARVVGTGTALRFTPR